MNCSRNFSLGNSACVQEDETWNRSIEPTRKYPTRKVNTPEEDRNVAFLQNTWDESRSDYIYINKNPATKKNINPFQKQKYMYPTISSPIAEGTEDKPDQLQLAFQNEVPMTG